MGRFLLVAIVYLGLSESRLHKVDFSLGRLDASLRLLLKSMQNVDGLRKSHRVHGSVRITLVVIHDLENCASTEALQRSGGSVSSTDLGLIEGKAHYLSDTRREGAQVFSRAPDPMVRSSLPAPMQNCPSARTCDAAAVPRKNCGHRFSLADVRGPGETP